jgi:hypothetical protein
VLDALNARGQGLPSQFSYRNFDRLTERGIEVSIDARLSDTVTGFANYSWQDDPVPSGFDISELNLPPTHRVNVGVSYSARRYFGNLTTSYQDHAFWQDVMDARFHGPTEPYTLVDTGLGMRSLDGTMTAAVRITNVLNHRTQQHVFGDVIRRTVTGEVRVLF